jgi:hypothetical protein
LSGPATGFAVPLFSLNLISGVPFFLSGTAPFAAGFAAGLTSGLAAGFSAGLASGFAVDLSAGLATGFVVGLSADFASGLAAGFSAGLATGFAIDLSAGFASGLEVGFAAGFSPGLAVSFFSVFTCSVFTGAFFSSFFSAKIFEGPNAVVAKKITAIRSADFFMSLGFCSLKRLSEKNALALPRQFYVKIYIFFHIFLLYMGKKRGRCTGADNYFTLLREWLPFKSNVQFVYRLKMAWRSVPVISFSGVLSESRDFTRKAFQIA